jgi:hypothetical protein
MGLTSWEEAPQGKVHKYDVAIAKTHAESEFEKFRIGQDRLFESDFDRVIKQIESGRRPDFGEE